MHPNSRTKLDIIHVCVNEKVLSSYKCILCVCWLFEKCLQHSQQKY